MDIGRDGANLPWEGVPDVELAYSAPKGLKFLFWLSFFIIIGARVAAPRTGFFTCREPPSPPKASEAAADIEVHAQSRNTAFIRNHRLRADW